MRADNSFKILENPKPEVVLILKILKNWYRRFPYFDIIIKPKPEAG
jgi:hypothetical protein